jgi:pimeloyl-ACP methyl ester carboxylesterase
VVRWELSVDAGLFEFEGRPESGHISGEVRKGKTRGTFEAIRIAKVDSATLDGYAGTYELDPGHLLVVSRSPWFGLTINDFSTGDVRMLWARSPREFSTGPGLLIPVPIEDKVTFVTSDRNEVTGLLLERSEVPKKSGKRLRFRREEVIFRNGQIRLAGTLVMPNSPGPHPTVVRTHGSGPALRESPSTEWLAYHGIASLVYDKRGAGKSTGSWQDATIADLADDALAGIEFLKGRPEIDRTRIGLTGGSEGGWVVPHAAARSKDVAFVFVGAASALSLADTIVYEVEMAGRAQRFSDDEIGRMKKLRGMFNRAVLSGKDWEELRTNIQRSRAERWFRYARVPDSLPKDITKDFENAERRRLDFDPRTSWEKIRIPVLAVWGALDRSVPVKESAARLEEALKQAGNRDYTLVTFPKGNHEGFEAETGFEDYARLRHYVPKYHKTILRWMMKRVK